MKFRTEINLDKQFELNPEDRVLAIGSCFADRMGSILAELDLDCDVNPFGVLYNPLSISKLIEKSFNPDITFPDWFEQNGHWMNLMYHGNISSTDRDTAENLAEELPTVIVFQRIVLTERYSAQKRFFQFGNRCWEI